MNFRIRSMFGGKDKNGKNDDSGTRDETSQTTQIDTPEGVVESQETAPIDNSEPFVEEIKEEVKNEPTAAQEEEQPRRPALRVRPKNPKELFLEAIPERSRFATANLKSHLAGKITFEIKSSGSKYTVDWSGEELQSAEGGSPEAACTIKISEADLMRIASGDLNPQVAMLSHKVSITGNPDHAVYAFNLIAPPANI